MRTTRETYYVYILLCADGTYYTGKTYDMKRRLKQHNGLLKGGAKYTSNRNPVKVVFIEEHPTNQLACSREYELKQLSRQQKEIIIKNTETLPKT